MKHKVQTNSYGSQWNNRAMMIINRCNVCLYMIRGDMVIVKETTSITIDEKHLIVFVG